MSVQLNHIATNLQRTGADLTWREPDLNQRANWAWAAMDHGFAAILMNNGANAKARAKHAELGK